MSTRENTGLIARASKRKIHAACPGHLTKIVATLISKSSSYNHEPLYATLGTKNLEKCEHDLEIP